MKISLILILLAAGTIFLFISCENENTSLVENNKNNLYVLVKYKTQPGKQEETLSALNDLILEVKKELNFVKIKLFVDPSDETNILLYEQWFDEAYYYGEHMNTPHLQKFMSDSRAFLAGPPDISSWNLYRNYSLD